MTNNLSFIPVLFGLVGAVLLPAGLHRRRCLKARIATCVPISGTVISNTARMGEDEVLFCPVVAYSVEGRNFTVEGADGKVEKRKEGSQMDVVYDPANPKIAYVVEGYYLVPNALMIIGGGFLLFGLGFYYEMSKSTL